MYKNTPDYELRRETKSGNLVAERRSRVIIYKINLGKSQIRIWERNYGQKES